MVDFYFITNSIDLEKKHEQLTKKYGQYFFDPVFNGDDATFMNFQTTNYGHVYTSSVFTAGKNQGVECIIDKDQVDFISFTALSSTIGLDNDIEVVRTWALNSVLEDELIYLTYLGCNERLEISGI